MIQKLTPEEVTFLKKYSSIIVTPQGNTWYHMPLWFKMDKNGVFETFNFDYLPDELKIQIKKIRDGK